MSKRITQCIIVARRRNDDGEKISERGANYEGKIKIATHSLNPARYFLSNDVFNDIHPNVAVVQAWDVRKFFTAVIKKNLFCLYTHFLECFETI